MTKHDRQAGLASILTVLFFILIISVITLSFLRISLQEGAQTLNDSLSKNAYAAAQSGINDAKRALIHCRQNGCGSTLTNQACPGFTTSPVIATLGITLNAADNSVQVGDPGLNERYTCVTIQSDTKDVSGTLNPDVADASAQFIPLRGISDFTSVRISWHIKDGTVDPATAGSFGSGNPRDDTTPQWKAAWPAMLRVMAIQTPAAGIALDGAGLMPGTNSNSLFFYPTDTAAALVINPFATTPRQTTTPCKDVAAPGYPAGITQTTYDCQVTLTIASGPTGPPAYLQLQAYYKATDFVVELIDSGGAVVAFDDVSPLIDSTGASGNVFRRVLARVKYSDAANPIQPAAVDIGGGICKNFSVTATPGGFDEDCAPQAGGN